MSKDVLLDFYYKTRRVPILSLDFNALSNVLPKVYINSYETIQLPKPNAEFKIKDFQEVMLKRRSVRLFLNEPISLETLSTLLYYTAGVTGFVSAYGYKNFPKRIYPSAGGLGEIEVYLLPSNVNGLKKFNVYHYNALHHTLENINNNEEEGKLLYENTLSVMPVNETYPAIVTLITAYAGKMIEKYKERGARFVFIDAGIVIENFYLVATALGLGIVSLGGFSDEIAEKVLRIDPTSELEIPILGMALGVPGE